MTGPVSTGEISVKAGQRLVVNLPKKETVITEEDDGRESVWLGSPWTDTADRAEAPASERPAPVAGRPTGRNPGRPPNGGPSMPSLARAEVGWKPWPRDNGTASSPRSIAPA